MQYKEAVEVLNSKAPSKYRGTQLALLSTLVRGCSDRNPLYKNKDIDSPSYPSEHKLHPRLVNRLCSKLGISAGQLRRVIKSMPEIQLIKWADNHIWLRLRNLSNLSELPDALDVVRQKHEARLKTFRLSAAKSRASKEKEVCYGGMLLGALFFMATHRNRKEGL